MEKPVAATDVGGVRELVGDAGLIVAAKDSNALAAAMLSIMQTSVEDRRRLGCAARAPHTEPVQQGNKGRRLGVAVFDLAASTKGLIA